MLLDVCVLDVLWPAEAGGYIMAAFEVVNSSLGNVNVSSAIDGAMDQVSWCVSFVRSSAYQ